MTKKYTTYPADSVKSFRQFSAYGNAYYIFGSGNSAVHLFPAYYKPSEDKGFVDIGLGFMVSFINTKKDQPVINLEFYAKSMDTFNSKKEDSRFYDRNEIGLRLAVPFNNLFKE